MVRHFIHFLQGVQSSVDFILNGELASSSSKKLHKCELTVSVKMQPELHGGQEQTRMCNKFIETYYGAFIDPCTSNSKQSLEPPPLTHTNYVYMYTC